MSPELLIAEALPYGIDPVGNRENPPAAVHMYGTELGPTDTPPTTVP